ncbi:MAG: RsmE family RNA methyltransferase [Miltoncostaeaceae bacterium]
MRHVFRYVVPDDPDAGAGAPDVVLGPDDSHHLARVVRRRAGDAVEVIGPSGGIWPCEVADLGPPARLRVTGPPRPSPRAPVVDLWVGLCEPACLDLIAGKAAELGVRSLGVMVTARARRVPDADAWAKRAARMGRVAEAAARQSGRGTWPAPGPLVPFDHVLTEIDAAQGVMLDPRASAPLADLLRSRPDGEGTVILVGPDTGFDESEVRSAADRGIPAVSLGAGMLRAETAAIAAAVLATAGRMHDGGDA